MLIFQQVNPDAILERGFNISPANVLGTLVMLLLLIIFYLVRENNLIKKETRFLNRKLLELESKTLNADELGMFEKLYSMMEKKLNSNG